MTILTISPSPASWGKKVGEAEKLQISDRGDMGAQILHPSKFPQNGIFSPKFCNFERQFSDKKEFPTN